MKLGKIVMGVLVTFVAGVAVGILYAPAKGAVTRRRMLRTGTEAADEVMEKFGEVSDAIRGEIDTVSKGAEELLKNGKKKALSLLKTKLF